MLPLCLSDALRCYITEPLAIQSVAWGLASKHSQQQIFPESSSTSKTNYMLSVHEYVPKQQIYQDPMLSLQRAYLRRKG
jgi:hypothetical protein